MSAAVRPIAPGILTGVGDDAALLGGRCGSCGTVTFPAQDGCPACGVAGMAVMPLGRRGVLWTWTTQGFLPKEPYAGTETEADFGGYVVGYVELPGEVKVEARLVGVDPDDVRIGMDLELVVVPFRRDADGTEVVTYAFRPAPSEARRA